MDVDEDETSETSETPKQIIDELHTLRQYVEYGRSARSGHPHVCLCIQQESGVSIAAHPAR